MDKYKYFKELADKARNSGWYNYSYEYISGEIKGKDDHDLLWFQGFAGILMALHYHKFKDNIPMINTWVVNVYNSIEKSNGVFLRTNDPQKIEGYNNKEDVGGMKYSKWEASKDQVLGLTTACFMLYKFVDNGFIKDYVKKIMVKLNDNLNAYNSPFFLRHKKEKRWYDSAFYCTVHYWGITEALNEILGFNHKRNILGAIGGLLTFQWYRPLYIKDRYELLYLFLNRDKKSVFWKGLWNYITGKGKNVKYSPVADFESNLDFYELMIYGLRSKKKAIKCLKLMDGYGCKVLKHFNIAACYLFLERYWDISGDSHNYYAEISKIDDLFFPEAKVQKFKGGRQETSCHTYPDENFNLTFENNYWSEVREMDPYEEGDKVDIGIYYCIRYLLKNFNK